MKLILKSTSHFRLLHWKYFIYVAALFLLPVYSYSSSTNASDGPREVVDLVVDVDWLNRNYQSEKLVVVDTRTHDQYLSGHIQGAVNIPVEFTFGKPPYNDLIAPISQIQKIFSSAGIDKETEVVLYDGGEYVNAARVFWVMEVYGHKKAKLLNGGYAVWKSKNYPVSKEITKLPHKVFLPSIVPNILSTKFSTRLAISDNTKLIVDARSEQEYIGSKSRTDRFGHIPSAVNKPFYLNYDRDDGHNRLKSISQLKNVYNDIDQDKKIIAYCNRGRESALTYFVLRRLGYNVSAYDGSWLEWSSDKSLPIVAPDETAN